jgi:type II secretory pathway pseudopilin PulG
MSSTRNNNRVRAGGSTFVELMVALVVVAVLFVAVTLLLTAASDTNSFINSQGQAAAEVETAYRRIMHNIRTASSLVTPTNTTTGSVLTVKTQPDPNNSNQPWTVTYKILNGNLVEDDPRYDTGGSTPNVLVTNVSTFTVTKSATSNPTCIQVTITSSSAPPITRSATIDCRNF